MLLSTFVSFLSVAACAIQSCGQDGVVALTFDDGPSANIPLLLQLLSDNGDVKVTFHVVREYLRDQQHIAWVQSCIDHGHVVGARLMQPIGGDVDTVCKVLLDYSAFFKATFGGYELQFLRLPYGTQATGPMRQAIQRLGLKLTESSLDSQDYLPGSSIDGIYQAFALVLQSTAPGFGSFICLQHDMIAPSVNAIPRIIQLVEERSYSLVTLQQCTAGSTDAGVPSGTDATGGGGTQLGASPFLTDGESNENSASGQILSLAALAFCFVVALAVH